MHSGEIVDLASERRLSAVADFTSAGAELLILNGGARAEEVSVELCRRAGGRAGPREVYCVDSGTSLALTFAAPAGEAGSDMLLRVTGGHGIIDLCATRPSRLRHVAGVRGWSTLAAAAVLVLLAGGKLDAPALVANADPEPAPLEAPLVRANVSLHASAKLPNVVAQPAAPHHRVPSVRPAKTISHRIPFVLPAAPPRLAEIATTPAPRMTDLHVPSTARSGDFIPVSFGSVGRQVKIVASIGPTIVSKTIIAAQHGVIAIRSPKSDLDSRVMTVRAYAQDGNRTSTLQAMVILVRP